MRSWGCSRRTAIRATCFGEFDAGSGHRAGRVDDDGEPDARVDLLLFAGDLDRQHVGNRRAVVAAVGKRRAAAAREQSDALILNGLGEAALAFVGEQPRRRIVEHDDIVVGVDEFAAQGVRGRRRQIETDTEKRAELIHGTALTVAHVEHAQGILDGDNATESVVGEIDIVRRTEFRRDIDESGLCRLELDPNGATGLAVERPGPAEHLVGIPEDDFEAAADADHVHRDAHGLAGPRSGRLEIHQERVFVGAQLDRVHGNTALLYLTE